MRTSPILRAVLDIWYLQLNSEYLQFTFWGQQSIKKCEDVTNPDFDRFLIFDVKNLIYLSKIFGHIREREVGRTETLRSRYGFTGGGGP